MVHGRVDAALRVGGTLPALTALSAGGYVGRDDAATLIASYRFLRTVEHRLQLLRLRRTHLLPTDEQQLRWLARSLGYKPDAPRRAPSTSWAPSSPCTPARCGGCTRSSSTGRCCPPWPACPASTCSSGSKAAGDWLRALGFADPDGALRHLAALTGGVSRSASMQKYLLPVLLQTFAVLPEPRRRPAGLPAGQRGARRQPVVPAAAARRGAGGRAARPAARLQPVRRVAAHPHAGGAAPARRRRPAGAARRRRRWPRRGGRRPARAADPQAGMRVLRGLRRQELLRIACADLLGPARRRPRGPGAHRHRRRHPPGRPGRRPAGLRHWRPASTSPTCRWTWRSSAWAGSAAARWATAPTPTSCSCTAPARGGRRRQGDRRGQRRRAHPAPAARRARSRPGVRGRRRPAARGAPGRAGPQPVGLPRVLRALGLGLGGAGAAAGGAGRRGRAAGRRLRRPDRPDPLPGRGPDRRAGRRDPPDQGPGRARAAAARRRPGHAHQARPRRARRRRVDRAAAAAAARRRGAGAAGAGRRSTASHALGTPGCWTPSRPTRCARRGSWPPARATRSSWCGAGRATSCRARGRSWSASRGPAATAPTLDPGQFLDDYRRTTRRARAGRRRTSSTAGPTGLTPSADGSTEGPWPVPVRRTMLSRGPHRGRRPAARGSGCGRLGGATLSPTLVRSLVAEFLGTGAAGLRRRRLGGRRHRRHRRVRCGVRLRVDAAGAGLRDRPDLRLPHQSGGDPRGAALAGDDDDRGRRTTGSPSSPAASRGPRCCSC